MQLRVITDFNELLVLAKGKEIWLQKESSIETVKRIIKLLQEGTPLRVEKHDGGFQSAVSKIWCTYKQNWKVLKGKHV